MAQRGKSAGPDDKRALVNLLGDQIEFADILVLGHVGDDLTLNETTRHFLEEDEFLVRARVHRDVG